MMNNYKHSLSIASVWSITTADDCVHTWQAWQRKKHLHFSCNRLNYKSGFSFTNANNRPWNLSGEWKKNWIRYKGWVKKRGWLWHTTMSILMNYVTLHFNNHIIYGNYLYYRFSKSKMWCNISVSQGTELIRPDIVESQSQPLFLWPTLYLGIHSTASFE